jgi:hypothetical protein
MTHPKVSHEDSPSSLKRGALQMPTTKQPNCQTSMPSIGASGPIAEGTLLVSSRVTPVLWKHPVDRERAAKDTDPAISRQPSLNTIFRVSSESFSVIL